MTDIVSRIRSHALEHYNEDGWDILVECYEDEDILDYVEAANYDFEKALALIGEDLKISDDHRKDIQGTAW